MVDQNAIVPYSPSPLIPTMDEVHVMNEMARSTGFSSMLNSASHEHAKRAGDAFMIMMMGYELGIPPMRALQTIYVVKGKPSMSAQAMLSVALHRGVEVELPNFSEVKDSATVRIKLPGKDTWQEMTYDLERAKKAGLSNNENWLKYPTEMLVWRAVSMALRFYAPHIIGGLYTPEELDVPVNEEGQPLTITIEKPATPKNPVPAPKKPVAAAPASAKDKVVTLDDFVGKDGKPVSAEKWWIRPESGYVFRQDDPSEDTLAQCVGPFSSEERALDAGNKNTVENDIHPELVGPDDNLEDVDFPATDTPYIPPVKNWGEDPKYKNTYVAWLEQVARKVLHLELDELAMHVLGFKSIDEMLKKQPKLPELLVLLKTAVISEQIFVYVYKVTTRIENKVKNTKILSVDLGFGKLEFRTRQPFIDAGWIEGHEDPIWRDVGEHIVDPAIAIQITEEKGKLAIAFVEAPDFEEMAKEVQ